jgi:hypothetical protein
MGPTCRRCSKNSGGGIAPAAICALIEGMSCKVNALPGPASPGKSLEGRVKVLMRLNFPCRPVNG